ncbi:hypothetical protein ABE957_16665 [Halomonas sp. CS7]|uniref:Uncharacterized protein n=1 Tax=Halomonas pelophila TaxID=3151122 RepID=A0ABV1N992_9GAMM
MIIMHSVACGCVEFRPCGSWPHHVQAGERGLFEIAHGPIHEFDIARCEGPWRMVAAVGFRYNSGLFRAAAAAVFPPQIQASEPMLETNAIHNLIKDLSERTDVLRGYL